MKTYIELLCYGVLSLIITLVLIPIIKEVAIKLNLVDKPNQRKVHTNPVPLVGGISIGISILIVCLLLINKTNFIEDYVLILTCSFILLVVGVIDDKIDVNAKHKLLIQLIVSFFIAMSGIRILSLHGILGIHEIDLWAQYLLTVIVITGVVNAFNLMDGVDGLVGGLSLLGFIMFLIASLFFEDNLLGIVSVVFIGAIIAFLKFNLSAKKIFMGDSGSLFLGFILVTLGIRMTERQMTDDQNNFALPFLFVVSFFSIPVFDSIRVYLGRMKKGNSPFLADKSHLHHLLLKAGLDHKKITLTVVVLCMGLFFIGFGLASFFSVTIIVLAVLFFLWITIRFLLMISKLKEWSAIIKEMEENKR